MAHFFEQLAAGLYLYSAGRRQKGTCSQTAQYTACFSHQRSVAWRRAAVLAWGLLHGAGQVVQDFYKKAKQAVFGEAKIGLEKLRHMLSVLLTFLR